jgi:phosphopantothenoylcysteine decarboxylase/phosphopantothenate--cysteine ligase
MLAIYKDSKEFLTWIKRNEAFLKLIAGMAEEYLSNVEGDKTPSVVDFAEEMDEEFGLKNAKDMLEQKGVDAVCYNLLSNSSSFGTSQNEITFISKESSVELGRADKLVLSEAILENSKGLIDA